MFTQRSLPPGGGVKMPQDYPAQSPLPYGLFAAGVKAYPVLLDNVRTEHEIKISGNLIWAYDASDLAANFTLKFNTLESDGVIIREGFFIAGPKFSRLYISHEAQAGKYINLLYTEDGRRDVRVINPNQTAATVEITKAGTINAWADVVVGAGARAVISVALPEKRNVHIRNKALNPAAFRIGDIAVNATSGIELNPGEYIDIETTAAIYAWNTGVVDQSITLTTTED